jgi:transposase InsO family protein
VVINTTLFL